jgi:phosphoribosylglycinamide formyltransferase-1
LKNLLILASGSGSNAENIVNHFRENEKIKVAVIGTNRKDAYVLHRAQNLNVPSFTFQSQDLKLPALEEHWSKFQIDYIILAGFLLKIPSWMLTSYPDRIINIHPALLPKYGGKGMYGDHVHKAVIENKERHTGISIHLVNENYDEGRIIFQASTLISEEDTYETIAKKVHQLEYDHFPRIIEDYIHSQV